MDTCGGRWAIGTSAPFTPYGATTRFPDATDGCRSPSATERALAPEGSLLLGWRVHRGVRLIGGMSLQHIRWSSIRYRAPSELPLPDVVLRRLPEGLRLTSAHVTFGVSFDATDPFGK